MTTPTELAPYFRADWGTCSWVAQGLWRFRLKNPRGILMVNSYVWRTAHMTLIIDPGWPWTLDAFIKALADTGVLPDGFDAVDIFLYTHSHIDHMGAAALLERRCNALHMAYEGLRPKLQSWHAFQDKSNNWRSWVEDSFVAPFRGELLAQMDERSASRGHRTMCSFYGAGAITQIKTFGFGDVLDFDGLHLCVEDARGHDPTHVAFFDRTRGWLFGGDVVLAIPTPISPPMHDDFALYEAALDRLEQLGACMLMPGHGSVIRGEQRVRDAVMRSRHFVKRHRLALMAACQESADPQDLYTLAISSTPQKKRLESMSSWFVHLALTHAHAHVLTERGELMEVHNERGLCYTLSVAAR